MTALTVSTASLLNLHAPEGPAWLFLGVALHPGAERYYREKGWLK